MKIGDKIKIKVDHGYWGKGHEGIIKTEKMKAWNTHGGITKIYDLGILLDGDPCQSGFDEDELELSQ